MIYDKYPNSKIEQLSNLPADKGLSGAATCYVAVPVHELEKLEEARKILYTILDKELRENAAFRIQIQNEVTNQMWLIANTKKWD